MSVSGGQGAEVAQRLELTGEVVGRRRHQQAEEGEAAGLVEAADDAEVEQRGAAVGEHEEVPAVQVAVEDAVDHGALHEPDHPGAHDGLGVDAGVLHAGHVVELEALEPLHHQHPWRDQLGVRAGDHVAALVEVGEGLRHVEHVLRLDAEVELLGDRLGEQLDQRRRVGQRGDRDAPDRERRDPRHHPEVLVDELADRRALHLHHDVLAGAQRGAVHLGDRRRRQRLGVEALEHLLERPAEVLLDDRAAPR